ncbi:MFS transporter [Sporomusa termitida]|uniref:Inner membrane metabolite transport protein YgcS n=1 Tax=Sporomusa termitida TaxID=2377 RepID=A0A517DP53_9FIRM|nr:MFS transporter [Sporomusa termitida]QDR79132.1 Inner membrane metabolite transport protein YgcS [Sporomusa termitida]
MTTSNLIKFDDVPLNKFHLKMTGITFAAHFTDGFSLGVIGIALTVITPQMGLSPFWQGLIGSSALIGLFLGSLVLGWVSDYVGRQRIFMLNFVLIATATFFQFFVQTPEQLFLLRILIGIGLGGDYSVGHTMLAEFLPRKHRGAILGSFSVIWTFGYVAASFLGVYLQSTLADSWRWLLVSAFPLAMFVIFYRIGSPESPRWLLRQGRTEEAHAIVKKYLGPTVVLDDETVAQGTGKFIDLFSRKLIKRTLFNCIFFMCLVIPYFAIYTFLPDILKTMGLSENFSTNMLLNALLVVGAFCGIWWTIKFSRRGFLINSFIFLGISLLALGLLPPSAKTLMIITFAAFTLVMSAVSNLVGVFPAESFPTDVRSSGVGLATAASRLGAAVGTFLLPMSIANLGMSYTLLWLTGTLVVGTIVSIAWAPETKTLTLSEASTPDKPIHSA